MNSASRPIADIQADYNAAKAARQAILNGSQSGSINSGSGSTSFTAADLGTLNQLIRDLWDELTEAQDEAQYGSTYIQVETFRRIL